MAAFIKAVNEKPTFQSQVTPLIHFYFSLDFEFSHNHTVCSGSFSSVQFSRSVVSDSLQPHERQAACQASLSITNSQSLLKLMSIRLFTKNNNWMFRFGGLL